MSSTETEYAVERKAFDAPDEVRQFPNGRAEILRIGGGEVGRFTFEPGWRWSEDIKPIAQTHSCQVPHFQYLVSGTLTVRMDDGTEITAQAGDVISIPSGHDGWTVGDEPAVAIEWHGASIFAKG